MRRCLSTSLAPPGTYQTLKLIDFAHVQLPANVVLMYYGGGEINKTFHMFKLVEHMQLSESVPSLVTPSSVASPFY